MSQVAMRGVIGPLLLVVLGAACQTAAPPRMDVEQPPSPVAAATAMPVQATPTPSPVPAPDYRRFLPSYFDQLPPEKQETVAKEAKQRAEALSRPPEPGRSVPEVPPSLGPAGGVVDLAHARTAVVRPAPPSGDAGPPAYLMDVSFVSTTEGFGVTYYGGIYHTTDAGDTWQRLYYLDASRLLQVHFVDATTGFAIGLQGCSINCDGPPVMLHTTNGGQHWEVFRPRGPEDEKSAWGALQYQILSADVGFAAPDLNQQCFDKHVLRTDDGGRQWRALPLPEGFTPSGGVSFLGPEEGFVTGWTADRSQVLATRDGGQTWQPIYDGDREFFLYAVHFLDRRQGFAGGGKEVVLATADGGAHWDVVHRRDHPINRGGAPITRLRFSTPSVGWAVTGGCDRMGMTGPCGGMPLFTSDGGHTWTVTGYIAVRLASVGTSAWIAGNPFLGDLGPFSLARTANAGATWKTFPPDRGGAPATYGVHFLDERVGWVRTGESVYQTRDGGEHWAPSRLTPSLTVAPTGPDSAVAYVRPDRGAPRLERTEDGGQTWRPVPLPPGSGRDEWHVSLAFADPRHGWLAMRTYCRSAYCPMVLYATADGGQTWEERTASLPGLDHSPEATQLAFGDEQHGGAINLGGQHLLLTADGGRTWRDQPLVGIMKVASLSYVGASEIWVAGSDEARGVLLHSRDAGQHWDVYRFEAFLAGQVSFATATDGWLTGRFEEQPGSLLATHDGGLTWQQVQPPLPRPPDGPAGRE